MNRIDSLSVGKFSLLWLLLCLLFVLGACTAISPPTPAPVEGEAGGQAGDDVMLVWEGFTDFVDGDVTKCKGLQITSDGQALVGYCNELKTVSDPTLPQWDEIQSRFMPFLWEIDGDFMIFNGTGEIGGPAWQRALLSWAEFTYGELAAGQVSASTRTVMSWQLGPVAGQADVCRQLIVLSHGYAYAATIPCDGGPTIASPGGWLETAEWEQFDAWLYGKAILNQEEGYLGGLGEEALSEADLDAVSAWAENIYTRLAATAATMATATAGDPACRQPFAAVETATQAAIVELVNTVEQTGLTAEAELPWPDGFWDSTVTNLVQAGVAYLNGCPDAHLSLAEQPDALAQLAAASRVVPEIAFVLPGEGDLLPAELTLRQEVAPTAQVLDVNLDGRDEVILHTQVAYFSQATLFGLRGAVSILYMATDSGWQGQVIWPAAFFGAPATDGYLEWSLDETYLTAQQGWTAAQALIYAPAQRVQPLPAVNEKGSSYLAVAGVAPGPASDISELAVWSWNPAAPDAQSVLALRLAWNHWCGDAPWTLLPDGHIHIAARPAFPEHGCAALTETLFVPGSQGYTVDGSVAQTPAAVHLRAMLAKQRRVALDAVTVHGVKTVEWPDACLGLTLTEELCAQVIVPGQIVTLTVQTQPGADPEAYIFHTDAQGYQVRMAQAPPVSIGEEILTWHNPNYDGGCRTAIVGTAGVAFGRCGGVLMNGFFFDPARATELANFVSTYAAASGETPSASITFVGQGERTPSATEMRMLAEWAGVVQYEAVAGRSDPELGRAMQWRQGTPLGNTAATAGSPDCREVAVYLYGQVYAGPCPGAPIFDSNSQRFWLNGEQLEQLYAWHAQVEPFTLPMETLAGHEGELTFWSLGLRPASPDDQDSIQRFVHSLMEEVAPLFS